MRLRFLVPTMIATLTGLAGCGTGTGGDSGGNVAATGASSVSGQSGAGGGSGSGSPSTTGSSTGSSAGNSGASGSTATSGSVTASGSGSGAATTSGTSSGSGSTSGTAAGTATGSGSGSGTASGASTSGPKDASSDAPATTTPTTYPNPFGCKFGWGEPAPSSLTALTYLQFVSNWAGYEINAAGTISACNNCTGFLKQAAATSLVPVYYAYFIGYYGHMNNLPDQNACCVGTTCMTCPATTPNLSTGMAYLLLNDPNGANAPCNSTTEFCSQNLIVQAYAYYAQQTAKAWPTKPLVWLLEGDFIQYTDATQVNSITSTSGTKVGLTLTQLGQLAALITTAIKSNMPNAIVAIDHSDWITAAQSQLYWAAMAQANYDLAWTTGPANMNGVLGAGVKYSDLHTWTGRKIYVDQWEPDTWADQSAATINSLIAAGVVALNSNNEPQGVPANYQTAVTALEPQLNSTCP